MREGSIILIKQREESPKEIGDAKWTHWNKFQTSQTIHWYTLEIQWHACKILTSGGRDT